MGGEWNIKRHYISRIITSGCISTFGVSHFKIKKIIFNVDNQSVVTIINKKSSKSTRVMSLVRNLVLSTLRYNIMLKAVHIPGINVIVDSLSRSDWQRVRRLSKC